MGILLVPETKKNNFLGTQKWVHIWSPEMGTSTIFKRKGPELGTECVPISGYRKLCFFWDFWNPKMCTFLNPKRSESKDSQDTSVWHEMSVQHEDRAPTHGSWHQRQSLRRIGLANWHAKWGTSNPFSRLQHHLLHVTSYHVYNMLT